MIHVRFQVLSSSQISALFLSLSLSLSLSLESRCSFSFSYYFFLFLWFCCPLPFSSSLFLSSCFIFVSLLSFFVPFFLSFLYSPFPFYFSLVFCSIFLLLFFFFSSFLLSPFSFLLSLFTCFSMDVTSEKNRANTIDIRTKSEMTISSSHIRSLFLSSSTGVTCVVIKQLCRPSQALQSISTTATAAQAKARTWSERQ